jgi:hypothetical protein
MKAFTLLLSLLAAGSLIAWHWLTTLPTPAPLAEPVVVSPSPAVIDGTLPGQSGQAMFTLTNRGDRPVTFIEVKSCCGAFPITDLQSRMIGPGQACDLTVQFAAPEAGVRKEKVEVFHDGSRVPVELTAELVGKRPVPYILEGGRQQVAFFDLNTTAATGTLRVTTCEQAEVMPWLGAPSCDLLGVTVERVSLKEERTGTAVLHTYEYRVGWNTLPVGREFFGTLSVKTTYGDPRIGMPPTVQIGSVAGTRAVDDDFAPKVARLSADGGWSDVIVFRLSPGANRWRFRDGWSAPAWLACVWEDQPDRQLLRITCRDGSKPPDAAQVQLPLTRDGRTVELPVQVDRP